MEKPTIKTKPKLKVSQVLTQHIETVTKSGDKTQRDIATEIGYDKPNIVTMFKQGQANLPINKVALMAKALYIDPAYLMRLCLQEYMPEAYEVIEEIMGVGVTFTKNEMDLIKLVRKGTGNSDPSFESLATVNILQEFIDNLNQASLPQQ